MYCQESLQGERSVTNVVLWAYLGCGDVCGWFDKIIRLLAIYMHAITDLFKFIMLCERISLNKE